MSESTRFVADAGPSEVQVYLDDGGDREPRPYARYRLDADGAADDVLALHRWSRTSAWSRSDGMPEGHRVASVEPDPHAGLDVGRLDRDQAAGRSRRREVQS